LRNAIAYLFLSMILSENRYPLFGIMLRRPRWDRRRRMNARPRSWSFLFQGSGIRDQVPQVSGSW